MIGAIGVAIALWLRPLCRAEQLQMRALIIWHVRPL